MPIVPMSRFLVLCDSVRVDPANDRRLDLLGVVSTFVGTGDPPFPAHRAQFTVYTQLTDCRGPVTAHIRIARADDGRPIAATPDRVFNLPSDPLQIAGVAVTVRDCVFPTPGLYWVQLLCEGKLIQEAPLTVR
jgi:hypothetical protein